MFSKVPPRSNVCKEVYATRLLHRLEGDDSALFPTHLACTVGAHFSMAVEPMAREASRSHFQRLVARRSLHCWFTVLFVVSMADSAWNLDGVGWWLSHISNFSSQK